MKTRYSIAEDISEASTLPGEFYRDAEAFEAMRERVFARSWQWLGHENEIERGHVRPLNLLDGCLNEPVVLTRDETGELRCLSNVCTHRANIIATESGACKKLRCRYHGRRFALDGKFDFMPEFEGAANFPRAADDLPSVALKSVQGFLFASLDPKHPIESLSGDMLGQIGQLPLSEAKLDPTSSRDYIFDANWALYVDNFLEGFHVPYIHPGLIETLDYENYRTELFELSNLQVGVAKGAGPVFELRAAGEGAHEQVAAAYYWLYPNTMFNVYPWGISINVVNPLAVDRTRVSFYSYVWNSELQEQGAGGALDQVQAEDEEVVLQVQRGIGSRLYKRGRYSPARETAVHHFHRLLCSDLA
ncbi:MAG: choline monooxygenase [Planctomycetota bacterium]|jgi:choline monooxygenase